MDGHRGRKWDARSLLVLKNKLGLGLDRVGGTFIPSNALLSAANAGSLFLWTQGGRENLVSDGAVEFSSSNDDHLEHPDDPDFEQSSFHLGGWVYLDDKSNTYQIITKFNTGGSPRGGFFLQYSSGDDIIRGIINDDTNSFSIVRSNSFGSPPTGVWLFIDFYWDGQELGLSINDGVRENTAFSGNINYDDASFMLGTFQDGSGTRDHLNGRLDSTFFYKGGTLTDSEITFLYNSGNGRTYAEVEAHSTLGTKFDGTSGYWWNLDEVSGTRYDATGGGKDLTPVNSPSLAQGVVAGQPSTEQAALSKWEDDSGKSHDPVQSTSVNKGFTWIDTDGKMYVEFGGDDGFICGGSTTDWEGVVRQDHSLHFVINPSSSVNNEVIFGLFTTNPDGNSEVWDVFKTSNDKIRVVVQVDGSARSVETVNTFVGSWILVSVIVRTDDTREIWINNNQVSTIVTTSGSPNYSDFNTQQNPALGAWNNQGSLDLHYNGRMKEAVICNDLSRFDAIRKELLQKHNL